MVNADALVARLRLSRVAMEIAKSKSGGGWGKWERYPAGTSKGGQFAPKGGGSGGSSGGNMWGNTFHEVGGPGWGHYSKPKAPSPGAKPHPKTDDHGKAVSIDYPSKPSHSSSWGNAKQSAVFVPGGEAPKSMHGVPMKPWSPPEKGWASVTGTNPKIDIDFPFEPHPTKKTGAGVLIVEPDGRLWLTRPTNAFGGYQNTYPKGTAESGLTLQQNAIKEAWEETGLKVKITGVLGDYDRDTSRARFYIAVREGGTPRDMGWESQAMTLATIKDARTLLNRSHDRDILADLEELFSIAKNNPGTKGGHWQNQPRWPGGSALGGQWKTMGSDGITLPPVIAGGLESKNPAYQKKVNALHAAAQKGDKVAVQQVADGLAVYAEKFTAGQKGTSHTKWNAGVHQYALQVLHDLDAGTKAAATADRVSGPPKLSEAFGTVVGNKPGGSNPGAMHADKSGEKWLIKGNKQLQIGSVSQAVSDDRARNEVLASKLMIAAGVGAPEMKLVDLEGQYGGGLGVASKWMPGEAFKPGSQAHVMAARADFAIHAWLANYDVLGQGFDNTTISPDGHAQNIDPGGALLFRAQGLPKGAEHGVIGGVLDKTAPEFESMRTTTGEQKAVFGGMTQSDIHASAEKLKAISDDTIRDLVKTYGPGNVDARAALAQNLIDRKNAILDKAGHTFHMQAGAVIASSAAPELPSATPTEEAASAKLYDLALNFTMSLDQLGDELHSGPRALIADALDSPLPYLKDEAESYKNDTSKHGRIAYAFWSEAASQKEKALAQSPATPARAIGASAPAAPKQTIEQLAEAAGAATGVSGATYLSVLNTEGIKTLQFFAENKTSHPSVQAFYQAAVQQKMAEQQQAAEKLAAAVAPPLPKIPEFSTGFPKADNFYAGLAKQAVAMHAVGNVNGLIALATYEDGHKKWGTHTQNGAKMQEFYDAILADAKIKQAGNVAAGVQMADAALSTPATSSPGPTGASVALPNFPAAKLPAGNANAKSHNGKVDTIEKLAAGGDVKGLLSLNFGTNTYGKQQAKLTNDVLAALGSPLKVVAGQKANSHPALFGGATLAQAAAATATVHIPMPKAHEVVKPKVNPDLLPTVPNFVTSNLAVKAENEGHAAALFALAANGDLTGLKSYDAFSQKSEKLTAFKQGLIESLEGQLFASRPKSGLHKAPPISAAPTPLAALGNHAAHFPPVKVTEVHKVAAHHKVAGFVLLGKTDPGAIAQAFANGWSGEALPSALVADHTATVAAASSADKSNISLYVGNWAYGANDQMRNKGHVTSQIREVSKTVHRLAKELPPGTILKRNMNLKGAGLSALLAAQAGDIIQSPQFESTANPTGGYGEGKNVRFNLITAPGVKGIYVGKKLGLSGEDEMLLPENTRYAIHRIYKKGEKTIVEAVILPTVRGFLE